MQISPIRGFNYGTNFVQQKNNLKTNSSITSVQKTLTFGKASNEEVLEIVKKLFTDITKISKEAETPDDMFKVWENFTPKADKVLDNIKENLMPLIKDFEPPENSRRNIIYSNINFCNTDKNINFYKINKSINFYKVDKKIYFEKCTPEGKTENLLGIDPLENTFCVTTKGLATYFGEKTCLKQAFVKKDYMRPAGKKDFYIGYYSDEYLSPLVRGSSIGSWTWDSYLDGFFI